MLDSPEACLPTCDQKLQLQRIKVKLNVTVLICHVLSFSHNKLMDLNEYLTRLFEENCSFKVDPSTLNL